jgi:hypothetical protein
MPLPHHKRTEEGAYRRERSDSLAKNLRKDYPEFNKVPGDTTLGALKKASGATSISGVRQYLRKNR